MAEADTLEQFAQQMRGLHLPEPVSHWWPLAAGWWLLLLTLFVLLAISAGWFFSRRRQTTLSSLLSSELHDAMQRWQNDGDTRAYLGCVNRLLKVMAVRTHGRTLVSRLSGDPWTAWLASVSKHQFSAPVAGALAVDCYRPDPDVDIPLVHGELQLWLRGLGDGDA